MFSFLRKNSLVKGVGRGAALAGVVLVFLACLLFVACPNPISNSGPNPSVVEIVPAELRGTWIDQTYGDSTYTITGTVFNSLIQGAVTYGGTVVNHREDGSGEGYITIKYTTAYNPANVGNYYVIHYKPYTTDPITAPIQLSACGDGDGKPTQAAAEAEYMVGNPYTVGGASTYFDSYSRVGKLGGGTFPNTMEGTWIGAVSSNTTPQLDITNKTIRYQTTSYGIISAAFVGEIVKVVNTNAVDGYLIFKMAATFSTAGLNNYFSPGGFSVLHWQSYDSGAGTANLGMGGISSAAWGGVSASQTVASIEAAETEWITAPITTNRKVFTKQ